MAEIQSRKKTRFFLKETGGGVNKYTGGKKINGKTEKREEDESQERNERWRRKCGMKGTGRGALTRRSMRNEGKKKQW